MRQLALRVLLSFSLLSLALSSQAEDTTNPEPTLQSKVAQLEQQLRQAEAALAAQDTSQTAQLQRLRQENQRLKIKLENAQQAQPAPLLTEQQLWFVIGAGCSLFSLLIGVFLRRRSSQRQWLFH